MKHTLLLFTILLFVACNKDDDDVDYVSKNEEEIVNYIAANNLTAQRSASGLYYVIETLGSGAKPISTDDVTVAYKGYYTSGSIFDASDASGISFNLQQVISGWTEGIAYFNEGGRGKLLIPAHLGYGNNTRNGIPGGSVLIFDIHLISID
jgi:FKBP-type peptidyl-prolyl cis-trans isomerase FkpA